MEPLRKVTMRPYVDQSIGFTLETFDTFKTDSLGKSILAYRFTQYRSPSNEKIIFEGEDFHCSPCTAIDSDDCLRSLLSFLTLRKGDTDDECFEDYTPEQIKFSEQYAETLSLYAYEDNPQPWDETDLEDHC